MSGKLTGKYITEFIENPNPEINSILIYGNDEAVILHRQVSLMDFYKKQKYQITNINSSDFKNLTNTIIYEIDAKDFFSSSKIIFIHGIKDKDFLEISKYIEDLSSVKLIFITSEIVKSPKLRDFHEKFSQKSVALPCYSLEKQDCINYIANILSKNKVKPEDELIISILADLIGNNPFDIQNEMEKIVIISTKSKELRYENIKSIINSDENCLFELIDVFFAKQITNIVKSVKICQENNINTVLLVRVFYKYTCKLLIAIQNIKSGSSQAQEAKNAGIFFKKTNIFYKHIESWSLTDLEKLIIKLLYLDKNMRIANNINIMPSIMNLLR